MGPIGERNLTRRLRDGDLAETSFRIKLAVPIWLLIVLAAVLLRRTGQLDPGTQTFLIWIGGPVLALAIATIASWLLGGIARGLLGSLVAQGGDPFVPGYSEQEALIIAGREREAVDSYRSRLVAYPDDVGARLRLAELLLALGDHAEAARQFAHARPAATLAADRLRISVGLADVLRATGDHEALCGELSRCAREFPDTAGGEHARRELRAIVASRAAAERDAPARGDSAG